MSATAPRPEAVDLIPGDLVVRLRDGRPGIVAATQSPLARWHVWVRWAGSDPLSCATHWSELARMDVDERDGPDALGVWDQGHLMAMGAHGSDACAMAQRALDRVTAHHALDMQLLRVRRMRGR